MRALLLPVRADWYGVALGTVQEVVEAPVITPLPDAPRSVLGVVNVRGEVVPVLDTAALLALPPLGVAPVVAVVHTSRGPAGLATDEMPLARDLTEELGASPLPGAISRRRSADGAVVTVLDVEALTAAEALR